MYPEICRIPLLDLPINSYGLMILIGFFAALFVGLRRAKAVGISPDLIADVGIYSMIVGILGAKLTYLIEDPEARNFFDLSDGNLSFVGAVVGGLLPYVIVTYALRRGKKHLAVFNIKFFWFLVATLLSALLGARLVAVIHQSLDNGGMQGVLRDFGGGFVLYGGVITGIVMGIFIVKSRGESVLKVGDIAAPGIMLGLAFGRIGCLLNGCCWGHPTDAAWGIVFPPQSASYHHYVKQGVIERGAEQTPALHPTQIYETIAALAIFFILSALWRRRRRDGIALASLGLLYPAWRFFVEFYRGDNPEFWFLGLTFSQGISILVFVVSLVWMTTLLRPRNMREVDARAAQ